MWEPSLNKKFLEPAYSAKFVPFVRQSHQKDVKQKKVLKKLVPSIDWLLITLVALVVLCIQSAIATGGYSGFGKPPMFGDYEAQRHWMEITYNLPVSQWYVNGTDNDLMYWGLDYPPLTAYHSYVMGVIANTINQRWVALHSSRGIEELNHKLFMRLSAIFPFILMYLPALLLMTLTIKSSKISKESSFVVSALYAGLVTMDCAHFQYNSISLGLFIYSYVALIHDYTLSGSVFFVLAVNYKQMELYHSLPIFIFILARCLKRPLFGKLFESFFELMKVGVVVISTFGIIWLPFILNGSQSVMSVIQRIFPFNRGLYEDKVASIWCSFSFVLKLNNFLSLDQQIKMSTLVVLLACLPCLLVLFFRPTAKNFRYSLFISSLSFFLFSFQVHEKSILLAAIAALLLLDEHPVAVVWFLNISNISLFSLCLKDGNSYLLAYFIAYYAVTYAVLIHYELLKTSRMVSFALNASFLVGIGICVAELCLTPPQKLPHIFPLLNAVFSCCHFLLFLGYVNFIQLSQEFSKWVKKNE